MTRRSTIHFGIGLITVRVSSLEFGKTANVACLVPTNYGFASIKKVRVQNTLVLAFDRAATLALKLFLYAVICTF